MERSDISCLAELNPPKPVFFSSLKTLGRRGIALIVAETFLCSGVLPAWAAPTDLLRPAITATSAREELIKAVSDGGRRAGDGREVRSSEFEVRRQQKETEARDGGETRILLVEDSESGRLMSTEILQGAGYEVVAVGDFDAADRLLASEHFDLLFTDNRFPNAPHEPPADNRGVSLIQRYPKMRAILFTMDRSIIPDGFKRDIRNPETHVMILPKSSTSREMKDVVAALLKRGVQDGGAKPAVHQITPASSLLEGVRAPSRLGTIPIYSP